MADVLETRFASQKPVHNGIEQLCPPQQQPARLEKLPTHSVVDGRCVWYWQDGKTPANGWIVIDSPVPHVAGGGLFMHANATLSEVSDVACTMSAKLSVSAQPQIVGGKGGIRFDQSDERAPGVLERFIQDNALVISEYWATGGDLNTSHEVIDQHCRKHCIPGTTTALDALLRSLDSHSSSHEDIDSLIAEPIPEAGWPLRDFAVGFIMATTLQQLLKRTNPALLGRARLALQGFGCVGATFAKSVQIMGIGRVVAVSSQHGFLTNDQGIDCNTINARRQKATQDQTVSRYDRNCLEAGLTEDELASNQYHLREHGLTDEQHLIHFLSSVNAEVFIPCAQRYVLTPKVMATLIGNTFENVARDARYILAGANNVFSSTESKRFFLSTLDSASIKMLPEWVSNSGTSNLFMRACSGLVLKGHAVSNLETCAKDTNSFIHRAFSQLKDQLISSTSLFSACDSVAAARRKSGVSNLLGVDHLSHLTVVTPDLERAIRTFTGVCAARPIPGCKDCFMLADPTDPTVQIVQAPPSPSLDSLGVTIHYSVCNLQKARQVLREEGVAFRDRPAQDGLPEEIFVTGREASYRIAFREVENKQWPPFHKEQGPKQRTSDVAILEQTDHLAILITEDINAIVEFHKRFIGLNVVKTMFLNAGGAPEGENDMHLEIMDFPFDEQRTLVLTKALVAESFVAKILAKKHFSFPHHLAVGCQDAEASFAAVRRAGWQTVADCTTLDSSSGMRQFFMREEEAGFVVELIQRRPDQIKKDTGLDRACTDSALAQGDFRPGNIIPLTQGLDKCL